MIQASLALSGCFVRSADLCLQFSALSGQRSDFAGYLGWFDGRARQLMPLSPKEEALRMARMAGGNDELLQQARTALKNKDSQWAAQLAENSLVPGLPAEKIMADALDMLGEHQLSATGRNYILTQTQEYRQRSKK